MDYGIEGNYEYLIVHFMNGLLNQGTKSFFRYWIHWCVRDGNAWPGLRPGGFGIFLRPGWLLGDALKVLCTHTAFKFVVSKLTLLFFYLTRSVVLENNAINSVLALYWIDSYLPVHGDPYQLHPVTPKKCTISSSLGENLWPFID